MNKLDKRYRILHGKQTDGNLLGFGVLTSIIRQLSMFSVFSPLGYREKLPTAIIFWLHKIRSEIQSKEEMKALKTNISTG